MFLLALLLANPPELLIQRVAVVDARSAKPQPQMDVLIRGDRIVSVRKTRFPSAPKGATLIDGRGKFLIPGLWDMHVHGMQFDDLSALYVANGVTGVREMFDLTGQSFALRKRIQLGQLIGPRIVEAGRPIDGPDPYWSGSMAVGTPAEAKHAVDDLIAHGSDFIKVYSLLPREEFFAVAAEAKSRHVPFAGHVPESVTAIEASDAGMKSQEHLYGLLRECSPEFKEPVNIFTSHTLSYTLNHHWIKSFDAKYAERLFARLAKNHTYITPTLTVLYWLRHPEDPRQSAQYRFAYMPPGTKDDYESGRKERCARWTDADFRLEKAMFEKDLYFVRGLSHAGVPILAGSDVTNPYCFPGFGLHDELHWLVKAGLTNQQALRAATLTPAEYFGWQNKMGTIEPGKVADCVLLNENPLVDIDNTSKISAVLLRGKLFDRKALDGLLARLRRKAESVKGVPMGADYDDKSY